MMREFINIVESMNRNLEEGVASSGHQLVAFAITVAEAYDHAPIFDQSVRRSWDVLTKHNVEVLFAQIKRTVDIQFVPNDPYAIYSNDPKVQIRYMLWDMIINNRLLIYSGHSDTHPIFDPDENVIFRTVHDYYAHGKLRSIFKREIEKLGLHHNPPTVAELEEILPTIRLDRGGNIGHQFSFRGELNAFATHSRLVPSIAIPALFTEIIGQASYNNVVGEFPEQKVATLSGFDYKNVGQAISGSPADHRMKDIVAQIENDAETIKTTISAHPLIVVEDLQARIFG